MDREPVCGRCGRDAMLTLCEEEGGSAQRPNWAIACADCGAVIRRLNGVDTTTAMRRISERMKAIDERIAASGERREP